MHDYAVSQPNRIQCFSPRLHNPLFLCLSSSPSPPSVSRGRHLSPVRFFLFASFQVSFLSTIKGKKWNREFSPLPNSFLLYLAMDGYIPVCINADMDAEIAHVAIEGIRREIDLHHIAVAIAIRDYRHKSA